MTGGHMELEYCRMVVGNSEADGIQTCRWLSSRQNTAITVVLKNHETGWWITILSNSNRNISYIPRIGRTLCLNMQGKTRFGLVLISIWKRNKRLSWNTIDDSLPWRSWKCLKEQPLACTCSFIEIPVWWLCPSSGQHRQQNPMDRHHSPVKDYIWKLK